MDLGRDRGEVNAEALHLLAALDFQADRGGLGLHLHSPPEGGKYGGGCPRTQDSPTLYCSRTQFYLFSFLSRVASWALESRISRKTLRRSQECAPKRKPISVHSLHP